MTITILAFGITKEILGAASQAVVFAEEISAGEIKATLALKYPRLKQLTSFAIAVNGAYATDGTIINSGDEVAIIPPVSGG